MSQQNLEKIIIIDYGSQVTQLIARKVREAGVYSEIVNFNLVFEDIGTELYNLPYLININNSDFTFPITAAFSLIIKERIR